MGGKKKEQPQCCACRVEWAMWGNMNALYGAVCLFVGGVIAASIPEIMVNEEFPTNVGSVTRWISIATAMFVFFVEYPRSARKSKKTSVERPGQSYIAPFLHNLHFVGKNYIVRFSVYTLLLIPSFFNLSTIFGGITLFVACVCYFIAAINGESWKAPTLAWGPGAVKKHDDQQVKTIPDAPSVPPPRPPPQAMQNIGAPPSEPPPRVQ